MNQIIAEQGGSAENLASFLTTIQGIDLTNNVENLRNFNAAAQQLAEGTITVEQFTTAMEKMNAAA
jgi:hypothetical protein